MEQMNKLAETYGIRFNDDMLDGRDFYAREGSDKGFYLIEVGRRHMPIKVWFKCIWEDDTPCSFLGPLGFDLYNFKKDVDNDLIY